MLGIRQNPARGGEGIVSMTLNRREQAATREELATNLERARVTRAGVSSGLGMTTLRVDSAFNVASAPPEDVWLIRDFLDHVIRSQGEIPRPYSSLSENMRAAAQGWFPLVDVVHAMKQAAR